MSGQRYSVTIDVGANISQVRSAATEMQKIFNSMNLDAKGTSGITRLFGNLDKALNELQQKSNTALTGIADSRQVEKSVGKVNGILSSLMQEFQLLGQSAPKELVQAISGFSEKMQQAAESQKAYAKSIKDTKTEAEQLAKVEKNAGEKVAAAQKKRQEIINKQSQSRGKSNEYNKAIGIREAARVGKGSFTEKIAQAEAEIQKIANKYRENNIRINKTGFINESDTRKLKAEDLEDYKKQAEALKMWQEELAKYDSKTAEFKKQSKTEDTNYKNQTKALEEQDKILNDLQKQWDQATNKLKEFNQTGKEAEAFDKLKESFTKIFGEDTFKNVKNIDELNQALEKLANTAGEDVSSKIEKVKESLTSTNAPMESMQQDVEKVTQEFQRLGDTNEELDHLTYRLKYFFSLAGGFNLMRRAIRSAVTTTKELDAVMTQTAVVSEYTVGDMWKTLPKYSKEAKKLGTAIKDVYGAQTLYVQQGLDMNSAMDLGIETLKMARVANIGAEEATNSMTAALRGFNMELTETSAKRVNDVYSKLAQNTASNTQEISTAMSKTAALANSANMSFENTAAFLATIIESTREGAETAGTALKTVIARFSEVKKLYTEDQLTGTDEEGQEIDVNKIATALRTAGINMNEFFLGTKGLDEIFKELGSKWNNLTTVQQRYIATQAAGSRQQSRFLALMQNYNRTLELTDMAYNSAGSGQEQFEKTLDSLEAKTNQFKDTWDTLIMGIANSDMIKGFIDFGTQVLEIFNNIVEALSGGNGVIKSITSLGLAIGTFKLGRGLFGKNGILGALISKDPSKLGSNFGKTFVGGFQKSIVQQVQVGQAGAVKQYLGGYFYQNLGINKNELGFTIGNRGVKKAQAAYQNYLNREQEIREQEEDVSWGGTAYYDKELYKKKYEQNRNLYYQESGLTKEQADKVLENKGIKQSTIDYNALGNAATLAGTAVYGVTAALEANGKIGEKTAGVIKGVAAGFIAMGGAMKIVAALGKTFGFTTSLAGPVGIAIGAVALIAGVYDALNESEKERTERYKKELEESSESLTSLKNKYKELEDSIDSLTDKEDTFKGLIKGTQEWDDAVKDLNASVSTLVEKYPELIEALEYNENGILTLNKDKAKEIQEQYKDQVTNAEYRNIAAKNLVSYQNFQQKQYETNTKTAGFADLPIFSSDEDSVKKIKESIIDGIDQGLLAELASYSIDDIQDSTSKEYKNIIKLISNYLTDQGFNQIDIDSVVTEDALLQGAIGRELNRQAKENYDKEILQNSFEQRQKTIEDIFAAESGAIKNFALKGTEKIYSKAYESLNISDEELKGAGGLKAKWAASVGATYVNDRKYILNGQELKFEDDTVKAWAQTKAASKAVEEASEATQEWFSTQTKGVKDFVNGVGKRSDLDSKEIRQAFNTLDNGLFNYSDVKNKWQQSYNEIDRNIAEALGSNIFEKADKIDKEIEDLRKLPSTYDTNEEIKYLEEQREKLLSTFTLSALDLGVSAYDKIGNLITTASNNYGASSAQLLAENIIKGFEGQDFKNAETRNKFASALYEVNWNTIKSTDDLVLALRELGVIVNPTADGFNALAGSLLQTQKALKVLSLKDLEKEAKERLDLRDSLKSATSATFDKDTYNKLLSSGANRSDFIYTGQGYTYTGGQLKDLGQVIENNLGTVIKDTKDNLQKWLDEGKNFEEKIRTYQSRLPRTRREDFTKQQIMPNFLSGKLEETDTEKIRQGFQSLGIDKLYNEKIGDFVNLEDIATPEAMYDYYTKYLDLLTGYKDIETQIADIDKNAPFLGRTTDYVRQNGGNDQQQIAAAIVDAEKIGVNVKDFTNYAQQLSTLNTTLQDTAGEANGLAYAIAYDNMLMNQGITELASNYSEWEKILNKAITDEKIRSTQQYASIVMGLRETLQKLTGTTAEFSEKFLTSTKTLELFKKAAKGDAAAIADLKKAAAKNIIEIEADGKDLGGLEGKLNSEIDKLDLENIEVGVEMSSTVADTFESLLQMGIMSADSIAAAYEALNFEPPQITWEKISATDTTRAVTSGYVRVGDAYQKVESAADLTDTSEIYVPHVGGSSSAPSGGGTSKGGTKGSVNPPKSSGGGGGGKKEFKNDFDKYYNQVEDINELERQRNLLETDYNQLLKNETKSGKEIYDNLKKQLQLLKERRDLTADLAEKRKQQIIETTQAEEYSKVAKYAWWNESDLTIEIDWDAINKVKDSEEGDLIKEYVKKLEDFQGKYDDMIEQLEDIESTVQEIKERGQKEYQSLEDRTRDALIKQIQDKIDELTDVDQAISDANQRLFDSISQTLELQRQERSNAKTEEELADKENRLAYLQQDSSNANQLEIAKLQKEIDDARQDYTDNLIDQKISELQRQNDEAADQRQQQIDLMQHSLDWQEKSGAFWQEAYRLISEGTDATGALVHESALEQLLKQGEAWDSLSEEGKMAWLEELEDLVAQGFAYLEMGRQLEDIGTKAGSSITFTNANGQKLTGTVDKNGNVVVKNSDGSTTTYKDVFQDYSGAFRTFETEGEAKAAPKPVTGTAKPTTPVGSGGGTEDSPKGRQPKRTIDTKWTHNSTHHWHKVFYDGKESSEKDSYSSHVEGITEFTDAGQGGSWRIKCRICGYVMRTGITPKMMTSDGSFIEKPNQRYASGGLNTQTGPAWLDGTPSKPELVLNARDTQNFIELKDTLASIKSVGGFNLNGGDNYYDIKVQVDSLGSDYDVDRAIDRIKARIAQDGAYRNVNTLSRLR